MSTEIQYDEAKSYSGYLDKKSKNLISTWQKRYFQILDGKVMVYSAKKNDNQIKGQFNLEQISMPESVDSKIFQFNLESREFVLRAKNEEEKNKWINCIQKCKQVLVETRALRDRDSFRRKFEDPEAKKKDSLYKKNKIENAGKVTTEIIKKHGFVTNKEEKLSNELLASKGITQMIDVNDAKISKRIYHGFVFKKHKNHDYYQKRWFFIFSARPLFDNGYLEDDTDLDPTYQKDWLKFDTLFYFKLEGEEKKGSLELVNSHKIELLDKDDKFYLFLDVQDRRFDLYCESKAERDIWFEVLKNSRRTAKEYNASITKSPRNVEYLNSIFQLGEKELIKKMDKEKNVIVGNYNEGDFDVFEIAINNLGKTIEATLDGCNSNTPPKTDLLKAYATHMTKEYLEIIKNFWDKNHNDINIYETLKISMILFNFGERLYFLNVDDQNFQKNAKELIKIYTKKTYNNVLAVIENILKDERELKSVVSEKGMYITNGPYDLYELLMSTYNLVKDKKNKYLYQSILNLFYSSINQYLLGVETVLDNNDIIIEKEFLLAMANNSEEMTTLLNKLLLDIKNMKVLTEKEVNEYIKYDKLIEVIERISLKSVTTFVFCFLNDVGKYFKNVTFMSLDASNIYKSTCQIFGEYEHFTTSPVLKKTWNEILKLILYHYINLLLTSKLNNATVEQIREKIKTDADALKQSFEGIVGEKSTVSTIKILNDINDFLEVSPYMISSSCLTLREYIGPFFNVSVAKALIKLRTDFQSEDTSDAIQQCTEVLEKYQDNNKEDSNTMNFFQIIEKEMKRQAEEEERLKKRKTLATDTELGKKGIARIEEDAYDPEEEEKQKKMAVYDINDFMAEDEDEKEEENENENENIVIQYEEEDKDVDQEEVSDITYEGFMQKKSHSKWQTRYFQVKNGYLYWFKDKNSSIVQNKISIKNTLRVDSHKNKKFMMVVAFNPNDSIREDDEDTKESKELGGKVYKFSCQDDEERNAWVNAITKEMIKLKQGEEKIKRYKLAIPLRKKIVTDYFNLPGFNDDINYMKRAVLEEMNREDFFKPSQRKISAIKRRKLREERRKEQEKLEKMKNEENRKIEEDIKSGKDVSITNRLKFWFRTNLEDTLKSNLTSAQNVFDSAQNAIKTNFNSAQNVIKTNFNNAQNAIRTNINEYLEKKNK